MINICGLKLDNLDEIMVVNKKFDIVYYSRFDNQLLDKAEDKRYDCVGKNMFTVYPLMEKEDSSFNIAMTTGESITKKYQTFTDYEGKVFCTHNITVPLIRKGKIIGAVELSKDITTVEHVKEHINNFSDVIKNIDKEMKKNESILFDSIITNNKDLLKTIERAKCLAKTPNPILIYGETGTGKELVAQSIINYSGINRDKVVVQNCAAVPENLIESILFGTVKGAYTGAENKKGLFEKADGGIFFLDELNSLPYEVQGKLLRVLQDGKFRPVGSNEEKRANVKIITAMNVDPLTEMRNKRLRKDLFYRLNSSMLYILPLRERPDDIELLFAHYINETNQLYDRNVLGVTRKLKDFLKTYTWDGNIRELKHMAEEMVGMSNSEILDIGDLPAYMYNRTNAISDILDESSYDDPDKNILYYSSEKTKSTNSFSLVEELEKVEKKLIFKALSATNQNKSEAAKLLNIPRQTLSYKINKYK